MHSEVCNGIREFFKKRNTIVDILAMLFGIGTWVGINGTFMQLPLLVKAAPEDWKLPSYLTVIIQLGNVGPLAYTLIQNYLKKFPKYDTHLIYGLLSLATLSALFTAFFYDNTSIIFGNKHSLALFILTFITSINACTSSVLFMPYMGRFKETYMITFLIGEGLSGLIPSTIALIQGVGGAPQCVLTNNASFPGMEIYEKITPAPRFSTKTFFIFIFILMLLSCLGFLLMNHLKLCRAEYAVVAVTHGNQHQHETIANEASCINENEMNTRLSSHQYIRLLCNMFIINLFSNGVVNSIQSYFSLPYGQQAYHLSATLSVIANPVACCFALFLPHKSLRGIYILTLLASIMTIYAIVISTLSPVPPLHDTTVGAVIVIVVWTTLVAIVSYVKLSITSVMRSQGEKSLVWTGSLSQFGSFIGSVIMFFLINYTSIFKAAEEQSC